MPGDQEQKPDFQRWQKPAASASGAGSDDSSVPLRLSARGPWPALGGGTRLLDSIVAWHTVFSNKERKEKDFK